MPDGIQSSLHAKAMAFNPALTNTLEDAQAIAEFVIPGAHRAASIARRLRRIHARRTKARVKVNAYNS